MQKILPIFIASLVLAALAEWNSIYEIDEFGEREYLHKDRFFFTILTIIMAVFCGMRTAGNDTFAYRRGYELMATDASVFHTIDWALGANPGFQFVNACFRLLGISTQSFLMLYALVTVCTYLWFIRKYTSNIWFSVFLFSTMGCYTFSMAAIKQTVAVAFCLIGTDRAIEKKWGSFVFWVLLASTFHPYALMYLIIPFLMFRPWTKKTYLILAASGVTGVGLQSLLTSIVNVTSMIGEEYDVASFSGEGVNVLRAAVVWIPIIFSFMAKKVMREKEEQSENLITNLSMLNAAIMFIALFGTANYFARLANYFLIFQTIFLPQVFRSFNRESRRILFICAIAGYLLYFYYGTGIVNGGFDADYRFISFFEYVRTLF